MNDEPRDWQEHQMIEAQNEASKLEDECEELKGQILELLPQLKEARFLLRQVIYARCPTGTKFIDELETWSLEDLHERLVRCVDSETKLSRPACADRGPNPDGIQ